MAFIFSNLDFSIGYSRFKQKIRRRLLRAERAIGRTTEPFAPFLSPCGRPRPSDVEERPTAQISVLRNRLFGDGSPGPHLSSEGRCRSSTGRGFGLCGADVSPDQVPINLQSPKLLPYALLRGSEQRSRLLARSNS
jgi:hypothetical protein